MPSSKRLSTRASVRLLFSMCPLMASTKIVSNNPEIQGNRRGTNSCLRNSLTAKNNGRETHWACSSRRNFFWQYRHGTDLGFLSSSGLSISIPVASSVCCSCSVNGIISHYLEVVPQLGDVEKKWSQFSNGGRLWRPRISQALNLLPEKHPEGGAGDGFFCFFRIDLFIVHCLVWIKYIALMGRNLIYSFQLHNSSSEYLLNATNLANTHAIMRLAISSSIVFYALHSLPSR